MSHDVQAAWASTEIADYIMTNQTKFFGSLGTVGGWSVYAGRESGRQWPLADGVILAQNATSSDIRIALEFKRPNEGLHGILTALGQSMAYLEKGYNASAIVIPEKYVSHATPGDHLKKIIDVTASDNPVSVFTYKEPNPSALRPFSGKISCVREITLPSCRRVTSLSAAATSGDVSTLWAHVREGMSYPDAFFRYCQGVKILSSTGLEDLSDIRIPNELKEAVDRLSPGTDVYKYLSNTPGDGISDKAWRNVWFRFYFWNDLMPIYRTKSPYAINALETKIKKTETDYCGLFSGRSDSIKCKLVNKLNAGTITENEAWEEYAVRVRSVSHSYREVIDSGLFHIGFLQEDGSLSDLGYKYVDACERVSSSMSGIPLEILKAASLQNGQFGAFLHYIYQLSEEKFADDNFAFTERLASGRYKFKQKDYLIWLDDVFANELHISKKSTIRTAAGTRNAFQAEIAYLKKLGFIKGDDRNTKYRIGVGIEIDWPQVQNSMLYAQTLE